MSVDQAFKEVLDKIPEPDAAALIAHGITDLNKLVDKKSLFDQLEGICADVQMVLKVVCNYLESLDSTSSFTWEGFENFCEFNDTSGDAIVEDMADQNKKEINTADSDPDGFNLTAEERKQMEENVENDPLTMKIRGFSSRSLQFEVDDFNKKKLVDDSSGKTEVTFNGIVFCVKNCYHYQLPNGENVIVGIRKFTKVRSLAAIVRLALPGIFHSPLTHLKLFVYPYCIQNEKKAICTLIVPLKETIMGPGLEEEPPIGVPATYDEDQTGLPTHVQVREKPGAEPIVPLSALKACHEPSKMPECMFERQHVGQPPHNFGFVYENDGSNRGEERGEVPFVDFFAGSGGFHQGVTQEPKFHGTAAVEWWDIACQTFAKNNPETPVYCTKVEDFLEEHGPAPADFRKKHGRCDVILFSSPCQSFSGSNRDVDHNSEKDLYRKNLSLKFTETMQTTGALVGVLENVEGMWRRPNVYFLKRICLDLLRTGYHFRVRLHISRVFGDPQARPRLLIYAAKKFVEMPNIVETHGPGLHPYMTVGHAFKALDKTLEKVKNNPDTASVPNMQGSKMSHPDKEEESLKLDKPAGTIRCGGRAWHPTKNRAILVREAASIQSYPPYYEFCGSLTDQYKQVGNAVPGKMAKAVAKAIAESLRFVYDEEAEL
jgi:DNA (cytosine-5)-methyltransferase 1